MKKLKLLAAVITVFVGAYCVLPCFRFSPKNAQALDIGGTYDEATLEEYFSSFDDISLETYEIDGYLFEDMWDEDYLLDENVDFYSYEDGVIDGNFVVDLTLSKTFYADDFEHELQEIVGEDESVPEGVIQIEYHFRYAKETNEFLLVVSSWTSDGGDVDILRGYPFQSEKNAEEIDVAFWVDDAPLYLSELEERGLVESGINSRRGFFKSALKFIAKAAVVVAATAAVIAVVAVAAPAVVAVAAGAAGTVVAAAGATAATAVAVFAVAGVTAIAADVGAYYLSRFTAESAATAAGVDATEREIAEMTDASAEEKIDVATNFWKNGNGDKSTILFRWGIKCNKNLTPKPGMDDEPSSNKDYLGLSFSDEFSPHKDFMVTTVKAVEKTECLTAIDDTLTGSDHHYTVTPVNYATFPEWLNSYDNAKKYPHPYTVALKQWVIGIHCL